MAITKQEYKTRWTEHIEDLNRIAWHLPEQADRDQLYTLVESLNDLIEVATTNVKE